MAPQCKCFTHLQGKTIFCIQAAEAGLQHGVDFSGHRLRLGEFVA